MESRKTVVQGACLILSHLAPDFAMDTLSRLMAPLITQLHGKSVFSKLLFSFNVCLDESSACNTRDLCAAVDILALFVRSVKLPAPARGHMCADVESEVMKERLQRHPAIRMVRSCGALFNSVLMRHPSNALASSISYLMTSLVTFISPAMSVMALPEFLEFTWTLHIKNMLNISFTASTDFIVECLDILGLLAEHSARVSLDLVASKSDSKSIAFLQAENAILLIITDMLNETSSLFSEKR